MKEIISAAEEQKFSVFSDKVRQALEDKMRNNPDVQRKKEEFNRYNTAKQSYSSISKRN